MARGVGALGADTGTSLRFGYCFSNFPPSMLDVTKTSARPVKTS